jgi:hypothetical protein
MHRSMHSGEQKLKGRSIGRFRGCVKLRLKGMGFPDNRLARLMTPTIQGRSVGPRE